MPVFKKILIGICLLFVLLLGGYFLLRNSLLQKALAKVGDKFRDKYGMEFTVEEAGFTGFARITLKNIVLSPANWDTLFTCKEATASFSLARLLKGQPPVNNAVLSDAHILLHESDSLHSNFKSLLSPAKPKSVHPEAKRHGGPGSMLNQAWKRFLALADFNFMISHLEIRWSAPGYFERLNIEEFNLTDTEMICHATDNITNGAVNWTIKGIINSREDLISLEGSHDDSLAREIPFFKKISGISSGLSRFSGEIKKPDDSYTVNGKVIAPFINHWRIAPEDVRIDSASVSLIIESADSTIHLAPGSTVMVNRARLNLESTFSRGKTTSIMLDAEMPELNADDFFSSLPDGLFSSVKGLKADGALSYSLHLNLNTASPDSVEFESDLNAKKFRIKKYGNENLSMMSGPFMYEARENDRVVKVFETGPANPTFTPYAEIPQLLVNCILISEDGTFWHHRGFNEEAFRKSIATNVKQKRFARGGSTISMQLVKNVHLNRNKTISRKIEEALLVWMIENLGLCSKERMMEVYVNVIEWGPGIYGIHDAAQYYFNKKPSELNLEECIFLASIIPNPKAFRYSFNPDGTLRSRMEGYYKLVAGRLAGKELITQQEADSITIQVNLSGPARDIVVKIDSSAADSSVLPEETEIELIP